MEQEVLVGDIHQLTLKIAQSKLLKELRFALTFYFSCFVFAVETKCGKVEGR
jgi:hypothetical protein